MRINRVLLIAASLSFMTMAASAQTPPPPEGAPKDPPPNGAPLQGPRATILFLTPYGKPFRVTLDGPLLPESAPSQVWFKATDTNQDGALGEDEFMQAASAFFDELDLNHDGVISDLENRNYENKIVPELIGPINMPNAMGGSGGKGGPPSGGGMRGPSGSADGPPKGAKGGGGGDFTPVTNSRGAEPFSLMKEPQAIRACDANFDFRITKEEWMNANQERFDILDKDHDRQLRMAELPQTQIEQRLMTPPNSKEMKKKGKPPLER